MNSPGIFRLSFFAQRRMTGEGDLLRVSGQGGDKPTPLPYTGMFVAQPLSYRVGRGLVPALATNQQSDD